MRAILVTNFEREFALWADHFEGYKLLLRRRYKKSSRRTHVHRIGKFWGWMKERKLLPQDLRAVHFQDYVEDLKRGDLCVMKASYSETTIVFLRRAALAWVRHLHKQGHLLLNPFEHFTAGNDPKRFDIPALTRDQVKTILDAPDLSTPLGIRNKAIFELAYGSGLRLGELSSLTLASFDLKERFVSLRDTKNNWDRRVPLTRSSVTALEDYLRHARPALMRRCSGMSLWVGVRGTLGYGGLLVLPKRYRKDFDFHFSMHDFRRAFATHLLEGGAQLGIISQLLGHVSPDSSRHYAKVILNELRATHERTHPRDKNLISQRP